MKILVIQTSRFGDLLQTTPMLHALRGGYPNASITVLARYNVMEIYKNSPDLDYLELFNIEEYTNRLMNNPKDIFTSYIELRDAVDHLQAMKFDMVVNTTHDRFSTFLAYLMTSPKIKGMYLSPNKKLHIQINGLWFQYLRCTSNFRMISSFNLADIYKNAVGGSKDTKRLFFHTNSETSSKAAGLLHPEGEKLDTVRYIGFQLGTSTGNRRWPSPYFTELGNMLHKDINTTVVLLGSKSEAGLGEKVSKSMTRKPINLIGKTDISLLAAVLSQCALLVTNDTGTMHLAEAVGTPCIALFFESANPFQTGPYGAGHLICAPDMDCFPCPTTFECRDKRCLHRVPVETIYRLIQDGPDKAETDPIPQPVGLRTFKTRFDALGVWDAWPLGKTSLKKNDIIRRLYRHTWLRYAFQSGEWDVGTSEDTLRNTLIEDLKQWLQGYFLQDPAIYDWLAEFKHPLEILVDHVDSGLTILNDMTLSGQMESLDLAWIKEKADELGLVDKKIIELGRDSSLLSQLTNLFQLELDQIHDARFFMMLNAWKQAYDRLKTRTALLKEEIRIIKGILVSNS